MAKIVLSDVAPKDQKSFSLANDNFDVPYETTDATVIANALAHPWLDVDYGKQYAVDPQFVDRQVAPKDDPLSAVNSVANDPKAVKAALAARDDLNVTPLAVEAGLDQDKPETVGEGDHEVAVTLAADDTDSTEAPKRRSVKKED